MTARRSIGPLVGALAIATSLLGAQVGSASAHANQTYNRSSKTNYAFQLVASPHDPTFTQLLGINDQQVIAGYDGSGQTVDGVLHPNKGFTLTLPSTFTPENYPASMQTQVIGINNHGDTAGFYIDAAGATHGFVEHNGRFSTTDLPGTPFNQLLGLNNQGQAAGYFQDAAGLNHAYVRDGRGVYTVLPLPNSQATGINDRGVVVGFTQATTTTSSAFVWQNERATLLSYPGSTFTQALGENDQGQIVGTYNDAAGNGHGFVYGHGAFQTLDAPGTSGTVVNGINDRGQIVGFFTDAAGNTVGFVGTPTNSRAVTLVASLLGKNEVPSPGDPNGGGTALVTLYPNRSQVCYSIAVGGLQGTVTEAHIHQGAAGATGSVVVHFMAPAQGSVSGCIGAAANLLSQIAQNPAGFYVNVHTTTFPTGAARGQLSK
jgi:probable HAF family extracellular repeat protein